MSMTDETPPTGLVNVQNTLYVASDKGLWLDKGIYAGWNRIARYSDLGNIVNSTTPNNFRNNAATFTLPLTNLTNYGTFYGTTATWTLGTIAAGSNVTYYIKNAGSGVLTINSAAGGNDIYYTSAVATISIAAGNAIIIHNDGVNWQVE